MRTFVFSSLVTALVVSSWILWICKRGEILGDEGIRVFGLGAKRTKALGNSSEARCKQTRRERKLARNPTRTRVPPPPPPLLVCPGSPGFTYVCYNFFEGYGDSVDSFLIVAEERDGLSGFHDQPAVVLFEQLAFVAIEFVSFFLFELTEFEEPVCVGGGLELLFQTINK